MHQFVYGQLVVTVQLTDKGSLSAVVPALTQPLFALKHSMSCVVMAVVQLVRLPAQQLLAMVKVPLVSAMAPPHPAIPGEPLTAVSADGGGNIGEAQEQHREHDADLDEHAPASTSCAIAVFAGYTVGLRRRPDILVSSARYLWHALRSSLLRETTQKGESTCQR